MPPREKLRRLCGRLPARCVWCGIASGTTAEIAGRSGAELAMVDTEHGAIGPTEMQEMLRALAATGTAAMVRLGGLSEAEAKRALDAGAGGVLFPYVETAAEAEAAVAMSLYPPRGRRGQASAVIRASGFGRDADYVAGWNDRAVIGIQIESRRGHAAVREIAAVAGVDMLFFGPFDYAMDAGLDPASDGAPLLAAFGEIAAAARERGLAIGVFPWPGTTAAGLAAAGADLVAVASDAATLSRALAEAVQASVLSSSEVS